MTKRTLITLIFIVSCNVINAQSPNKMDCAELKQRIDAVFKNNTSIWVRYLSSERDIYVNYEQDLMSNSHLIVSEYKKKVLRQVLINVEGKKYFTKDTMNAPDVNIWEDKIPNAFDEKAWTDSCKLANTVFNLPFNSCFLSKEQMITGIPFAIYSIDIANDTFNVWLNKTTNKLERIKGQNKVKAIQFEWSFDTDFKVSAPPKSLKDTPQFGLRMFAPSYSYDELDGNERVFGIVDKNAQYKDGEKAMFQFLAANIKYPQEARGNGRQGNVYVGFVVEKDGTLTNFKVKRGFSSDCNEESIRVVKAMSGNWEAGVFNGQKVRQAYTLPIKFRLE